MGPLATGNLIGVYADDDTAVAVRLMREHEVRRLPVIEDGQVAGVVSLGDLAMHDDPAAELGWVSEHQQGKRTSPRPVS